MEGTWQAQLISVCNNGPFCMGVTQLVCLWQGPDLEGCCRCGVWHGPRGGGRVCLLGFSGSWSPLVLAGGWALTLTHPWPSSPQTHTWVLSLPCTPRQSWLHTLGQAVLTVPNAVPLTCLVVTHQLQYDGACTLRCFTPTWTFSQMWYAHDPAITLTRVAG